MSNLDVAISLKIIFYEVIIRRFDPSSNNFYISFNFQIQNCKFDLLEVEYVTKTFHISKRICVSPNNRQICIELYQIQALTKRLKLFEELFQRLNGHA